ncbi:putative acyl-CoA oxidase [Hypoxylon trugodes]|uniref:putative acyl-CoA oxidase n=1 Tax=Hypoxylon trugodes TaxID=326681 RepID=UPI00219A8DE6|nr:putative acyl-CoA oxidase [Hypoxylon trugodes]KAI1392473.1 putative acyl-CoA oxidase [Hypoxylon trugodes]
MTSYDYVLKDGDYDTSCDYLEFPNPAYIKQCYRRAHTICQKAGITIDDIVRMRPKFWGFNRHLVAMRDPAVSTILGIHWNLCMGTIARFSHDQPHLVKLLEDLERFDICGEFLLTEVSHGLDAYNLETTATLLPDGSFELHTSNSGAAKAMPPTTPWAGMPRVGVVSARLLVGDVGRGVRPFVVRLNDANEMSPGVISQPLPKKSGSKALDHAITTFNRVRLGSDSLLGSLNVSSNERSDFLDLISRVSVGTLSFSMGNIPALRQAAYIAGTYSLRRHVAGNSPSQRVPIIRFSTQYRPILNALSQALVFDAFAEDAIKMFCQGGLSSAVNHSVATCFKATVGPATQITLVQLADRCGWQGLFNYNRIIEMASTLKGNGIAEGDYTVLCIRLVSEVLLGRYELPPAKIKDCRLARHEAGVWQEARDTLASVAMSSHRGKAYNTYILPRSRALVEASGHRMAYEAALDKEGFSREVLALFESTCVMSDLGWYCIDENGSRQELLAYDAEVAEKLLPRLRELLSETGAASWTTAPITSTEAWDELLRKLPVYRCNGTNREKPRL